MVKEIIKDTQILQQKSEEFKFGEDDYLITDLIDTANANIEHCAGLACIQIGTAKKVVVVRIGDKFVPMINPMIIKRSQETFVAKEKCLSLEGEREVKRHKKIKVGYTSQNGKRKCEDFGGFVAQVIQHECDHLKGILI